MKKYVKLSLLAMTVSALGACSMNSLPAERAYDRSTAKASKARDMMRDRPAMRAGAVQMSDGIFMAASREDASKGKDLPARLLRPGAVTFSTREAMTLEDILRRLSDITNIPHVVRVGEDNIAVTVSEDVGEDVEELADAVSIPARDATKMRLNARDPLPDILNKIGNHFSLEWSYEGNRIVFRDMVTRQYQISALAIGQSGSSTAGGVSSSATNNVYEDVVSGLEAIISPNARIGQGNSTGILTVTASVDDHIRIEKYIDNMNDMLNKQIAFDVNVLTVTLNKGTSTGLDLSSAIADTVGILPDQGRVSLGSNFGSVSLGVTAGDISVSALAEALSRQGRVSVDMRAGVTTSNNRMVPVEVVDEVSYVASISVETDDNGNERLIPQPETEDIGFKLQIYPRIMNSREVMVQYSVNISELNELASFGSGSSQVQLPNVSQTAFDQQTILQTGQTLILSGFDRNRYEITDSKGILSRGQQKSMERVSTVIMITPQILNRTRPIYSR